MENIKVQFKGITRNTDDGICSDGECMELINARLNNGSIEPVGKSIQLAMTEHEYKSVSYHANAKRYIGITGEGQLYEMPEDFSSETILSDSVTATKVDFIGNTMAALTEEGLRYFLWQNNTYKYLGALPTLPSFSVTKVLNAIGTSGDSTLDTNDGKYAAYIKVINIANGKGYYSCSAAFRAAFRLYDGTYIRHSAIRFLYLTPDDQYSITIDQLPDQPGSSPIHATLKGSNNAQLEYGDGQELIFGNGMAYLLCFAPSFTFYGMDLEDWKDIIMSIDIFSSENFRKPFLISNIDTEKADKDFPTPGERLKDVSLFYKIYSFPISSDTQFAFATTGINVSADILATQEELPDDTGTNNDISATNCYIYNNRIHVNGIKTILFKGYVDNLYDNVKSPNTAAHDVYVFLKDDNGEERVLKQSGVMCDRNSISPYLMYPDYRAYKMVIVNSLTKTKYKEFQLVKHARLNCAYFMNLSSTNIKLKMPELSTFQTHTDAWSTEETSNVANERDNIIKVSALNNPFYFPADQTYQFQAPIIGMQSNVIAMSQGQFGQYPLYVFTKDGVYVMQIGTADVAYATQTPVTRDVCNNPNSICGLDTAVAFSTDRGLMTISGTQTQLISEDIYGFLPSCTLSSPIISRILDVANLTDSLSSVTFPDYLKEAKVGFNYQEHQIVVANKEYSYCYVYSLKTGMWHKISQTVTNFINSYPHTWALNGMQVLDLNNTHRSISTMAMITRPIKMGTLTHKRILQSALRGIVKRSLSDLYLRGEPVMFRGDNVDIFSDVGMYILGSNDAEHFTLIAKKEMMTDIRDLVTKMNKSKPYKYFMLCLVGGVRTDVSINYMELTADESFANRLR